MTIPLVPKIEIPPMIPSLGLSVFSAISFPLGTDITSFIPFFLRIDSATSVIFSIIIFFGVGLIAASPISKPKPGLVTRPTPFPPSISIVFILVVSSKSTMISAPCVTSGSSPPSLITLHLAFSF